MQQNAPSFILLVFMGLTLLYVIHLSIVETNRNKMMQEKIMISAKRNIERYTENPNDLIAETLWETQVDLERELYKSFVESHFERLRKRMEDVLPYMVQTNMKRKIIRDVKKDLPSDVSDFVASNQKHVSQLKKLLEKKAKGETAPMTARPIPVEPDTIVADHNNLCSSSKTLKHHVKLLSYCVFGGRQLYYDGIDIVIRDARKLSLYKDWQVRVYHDGKIPAHKVKEYEKAPNIHLCDARYIPRYGNLTNILGKFWRVVPMADPSVDLFCPRDLDSNIITREEDAVKEFIKSGMILHTMRDHRQHEVGMMAGMWCFHNRVNRTMGRFYLERLLEKAKTYTRRTDQPLLNAVIWDHISKYHLYDLILQHDSYNCDFYKGSRPFPTKRKKDNEFIGCPVHNCDQKLKPCPEKCRPSYGKIWKYC